MARDITSVSALRKDLEQACRDAAEADPDGPTIEHINHRLVESGTALGRVLIARAKGGR